VIEVDRDERRLVIREDVAHGPEAASCMSLLTSCTLVARRAVKRQIDQRLRIVGTRMENPSSLPFEPRARRVRRRRPATGLGQYLHMVAGVRAQVGVIDVGEHLVVV